MGLNPSRDVFITCAVTGSGDTTHRSDKVPVTPRQIADAAIEAANAGAAIAHVHGIFGPLSTLRPSGSVPKRELPPALSKNANANASPRSGSTSTKRRSRMRGT